MDIDTKILENKEIHYATGLPIDFIRYKYKIGDKVRLNFNACNKGCGCYWRKDAAPFLDEREEYIIQDITYFGGGCPSIILHLEDVPETDKGLGNWWEKGVPANWFKVIK